MYEFTALEEVERELTQLENDFWQVSFPAEIDLYITEPFPNSLEMMSTSALGGRPVWFTTILSHKGSVYLEEHGLKAKALPL